MLLLLCYVVRSFELICVWTGLWKMRGQVRASLELGVSVSELLLVLVSSMFDIGLSFGACVLGLIIMFLMCVVSVTVLLVRCCYLRLISCLCGCVLISVLCRCVLSLSTVVSVLVSLRLTWDVSMRLLRVLFIFECAYARCALGLVLLWLS